MEEKTICYAGVGVSRPSETRLYMKSWSYRKVLFGIPRKISWKPVELTPLNLHTLRMPAVQNNRSSSDHAERVKVTVSLRREDHAFQVLLGHLRKSLCCTQQINGLLPKVEVPLGDIKYVGKTASAGKEAERNTVPLPTLAEHEHPGLRLGDISINGRRKLKLTQ